MPDDSVPPRATASSLADDASFVRGAELYASGAFWDAHEAWEHLWRGATDEGLRLLLQGMIQVAAAFYKLIDRGDVDACLRLLARGTAKLDGLPDELLGVEVRSFREAARSCALTIASDRAAGASFERSSAPRIRIVASAGEQPPGSRVITG